MKRILMMELLTNQIKTCYEQLSGSRSHPPAKVLKIEGLRCRLDELILYYCLVGGITFYEACKELNIPYNDVNVLEDEE